MAFETINLGTQPAGTGGDTARSAFEKTNRNFLAAEVLSAAMSQAQFDAILAQNNEEFAASGFVHFGKHYTEANNQSYVPINQGMWTHAFTPNALILGVADGATGIPNTATSKVNRPLINIAGVCFYLTYINSTIERTQVKFPQAPDGKTTYNKSTGVITTHATVTAAFNAQAADPTNVEVVTDRVDMWGFEAWLEEVSTTNPYIYPNGLTQSQATTMGGITTSASARPVTYYAVFDGDTGSKGKGLNFFALTDAQKKKVLANPRNNLYYLDDGRLVQWRLRQRTIAGAGNGDWLWVDSTNSSALGYTSISRIKPQGILNVAKPIGAGVNDEYLSTGHSVNTRKFTGIYEGNINASGIAVNSECYFLVCGTVNRLNQGAYHPSFNPSGASRLWDSTGTAPVYWYQSTRTFTSMADCFDFDTAANPDARKLKVISAQFSKPYNGSIGSNYPARPDGRFYDAIYADGQGGVCRDMRYSAYGIDSVNFAEADQRVKNGTYRGFELLKFTKVKDTGGVPQSSGSWDGGTKRVAYFTGNFFNLISGTLYNGKGFIVSKSSSVVRGVASISYSSSTGLTAVNLEGPLSDTWALDSYIVFPFEDKSSIGGSFLQTDVIGNPANILATPALANGWQGSWIPVIPDGTTKEFLASRKNISAVGRVSQYTTNNGGSWATGSWNIDGVKNSTSSFEPANRVTIVTYQAFAKQTENTVNAEVYSGHFGVGRVYSGSYSATDTGSLLCESLLNKILTSATNLPLIDDVALTKTKLQATKKLATSLSWGSTEHTSIFLNTPINNSPAFKALNYNVNLNQQAFIQYAYTELKHNGTNWGDDGKVTIVDNQATKTDLNGNTVLVGTAKLKEPIGWIKNKV